MLRAAGFDLREEVFAYSAFPGSYGTPIGGLIAVLAVLAAGWCGLARASAIAPLLVLGAGLAATGLFAVSMLGEAVLFTPAMRRQATNLVATREATSGEPRVWLVAHLDTKSQPIPSAARVAGIALLAFAIAIALLSALLQLGGAPSRTGWWAAVVLALLGAPGVVGATVGARSNGAVDNASGVAAVLEAVRRIPAGLALGVLLPSAEELGLAGARAWVRGRAERRGIALNCDGVDDTGALTIMYSGQPDHDLLDALRRSTALPLQVRRMPLGLLTDSVALADGGWRTVTVSRGGYRTLARVHSTRDSLDNLTGRGIDEAAALLARAVEALA